MSITLAEDYFLTKTLSGGYRIRTDDFYLAKVTL